MPQSGAHGAHTFKSGAHFGAHDYVASPTERSTIALQSTKTIPKITKTPPKITKTVTKPTKVLEKQHRSMRSGKKRSMLCPICHTLCQMCQILLKVCQICVSREWMAVFYDRALLVAVIVIVVASLPERHENLPHFLPDVSDTFESVSDLCQT